jgi:hypothetical protein
MNSKQSILNRWRFGLDTEEVSLHDLSWQEAVDLARATSAGDLTAQSDGEFAKLEFNATHAAVLYMGRDGVILRPYFPNRSAADQNLSRFFCGGCGIRVGSQDEYLARFFDREHGFRLFAAVVGSPSLPTEMPDISLGQLVLPGFADVVAAASVLEWRPLPPGEGRDA